MSFPFRDEALTPEERLARSRSRKRRRVELPSKGTLKIIEGFLNDEDCLDLKKCLFHKLIDSGLLDDQTDPEVAYWIEANTISLVKATSTCVSKNDSNGMEYIRAIFASSDKYKKISDIIHTTYTSILEAEDKCIFWAVCATFLVIYYEFSSDDIFVLPPNFTEEDLKQFLCLYPEFLCRTWDTRDLLQFKLCMRLSIRAFGSKSNMAAMVELITYMTKGKIVALCANTSGGGLKDFDRPTEVSTEKCRVLIYHRESGSSPRRRKNRDAHGSNGGFIHGMTPGLAGSMQMQHLGVSPMSYPNAMEYHFPQMGAGYPNGGGHGYYTPMGPPMMGQPMGHPMGQQMAGQQHMGAQYAYSQAMTTSYAQPGAYPSNSMMGYPPPGPYSNDGTGYASHPMSGHSSVQMGGAYIDPYLLQQQQQQGQQQELETQQWQAWQQQQQQSYQPESQNQLDQVWTRSDCGANDQKFRGSTP